MKPSNSAVTSGISTPIPFIAAANYAQAGAWVNALQAAMPAERIVAFDAMSDEDKLACQVAIVANPNPADLQQLPQLEWIHSVWAGVERLVVDLGDTHLKIVRLVDPQLANTMAEAVLAWTLYLHRDMPAYAKQQAQQIWQALDYVRPQQRRISLLGLGALGEAAAVSLLRAGFQVAGWSRHRKAIDGVNCFAGADELPVMLAQTDILVCLLPLTPDTRSLLNASTLAALPKGASLINFARGAIINDADLHAALDSGHLAHVVLDVFEVEPLPVSQWQWQHPSVTLLPHCSAPTDRQTASQIVAGNILRYRQSGVLPLTIDVQRGY
ncbi:glyoxylate/hydroxypyruvate reductase A [Undibacterium sp. CY18W]|uniref:Glyoxylate/hydroxypyruvate reductase A n=1 Tax=Undibacterium hunanense TaxID=2762292 RepID=A0ABR6ZJN8_9BURK|nr:glyoxylate/hydroxypyruvate reductase A [Undibacterium hunanense]MBC3916120.1 glyoxylate/hydroxypyruvate reductase A [Undibacterium hunanense]